jgi:regulator of RNase E activity RraA
LLKVVAVNVPVKLQTDEQDMEIRPGDYLIADINGVVILPVDLAEKALPLMQKQVQVSPSLLPSLSCVPLTKTSRKG